MLTSLIFYYTIFLFFSFLFYFQPTTTMSSNFFAAQICDVWTFKKVRERVGKSIWIQGQCLKVKNWTDWNMSLLFPDPASESITLIRNCSRFLWGLAIKPHIHSVKENHIFNDNVIDRFTKIRNKLIKDLKIHFSKFKILLNISNLFSFLKMFPIVVEYDWQWSDLVKKLWFSL